MESDFSAPSLPVTHIVKVPSISDHEFKVLIVVDGRGDVSVVLDELFQGDLSVSVLRVLQGVMDLERVQKFRQDFIFSALALNDIWVLLGIIGTFDVCDVENARAILVDLLKGLANKFLPYLIHLACYRSHQLIIGHLTVLVQVE